MFCTVLAARGKGKKLVTKRCLPNIRTGFSRSMNCPLPAEFREHLPREEIGALQSIVPGDGPAGRPPNDPRLYGDNPNNPRDPDRVLNTDPSDSDRDMVNNDDHKEKRLRFIPSGWITKSCSMFSSG